jgi:serine/threonine protein kinase/WD40 repeat protein
MPLTVGTKLGPYEILTPIGAGGMGEVYRARDAKLGRDVALKVLPETFARNAERLARFQREAKVLASLSHTNIAPIYGLEDSSTTHALVMELIEGPTLADRIGSGPIPIEESLRIAKQLCDALEYAHERGIVHRDLKPANVKLTIDDAVKVLDFGLAKAIEADAASIDIGTSPTMSRMATLEGVLLGTAAYMSPEQAKAKAVDRRADIWAFGCVLYEMLTGKMAFTGETVTDTLASIIKEEPDWSRLPVGTPQHARVLLQRCLQKDPKQRLRDIGDARIAIDEILSGAAPQVALSSALPTSSSLSVWRRALPWAIAGVVVGALIAGLVAWKFTAAPTSQSSMRFSAVTNFAGVQAQPALSPDGRSVAFVSNRDGHYNIYVGLISGGSLVQITNDANFKSRPAWSPDGTTIAYARFNDSGMWDIWEAPALGGTSRRVIFGAREPAWSPDGHSLAYVNAADGSLWVSGVFGEDAHQVAPKVSPLDFNTGPRFSPDGRQIVFVDRSGGPYGELNVVNLASGKIIQLTNDNALALSPVWSPDGRFIYFGSSRGGTVNIWKMTAAGGEARQITAGQGDDAQLDVSPDGTRIVFATWRQNIGIAQLDLPAKAGEPNVKLLTKDPGRNQIAPLYSPDGKYLAYFSNLKGAENEGIWISSVDGSNPVQLVRDSRVDVFPHWTADGQRLIYLSYFDEYRSVSVSGGAPETVLKLKALTDAYFDVGPDGRLLFRNLKRQVEVFDPRDNKTETYDTPQVSTREESLHWSPDGYSFAYVVAASRENDPIAGLWVDDFKNPPRQIFRGWVDSCARGHDGELYFIEGKADLSGVLWKVGWNGQGLERTAATIPMIQDYVLDPVMSPSDYFGVSPDGRHLAFMTQTVLGANIGMIENVR